jgi:3-methyladenine DNA glycosylase AlkD
VLTGLHEQGTTALTLASVRAQLRAAGNSETRAVTAKLVPTSQFVYGVRVPVLNALVRSCRPGGFELVEALWRSGAFEERLLAAKLLGAIARQDPVRALQFVKTASKDLSDWAVCDTLGTQGVRPIALAQRKTIVAMAERLTRSRHLWARRLAIVLLLHVAVDPTKRATIRRILAPLRSDKEPYIRKALAWIDRDLAK